MKILCALLSFLGIYWAWTSLGFYLLLAQIVFEGEAVAFDWLSYVLVGCVLVTVGYWVWSGWILRAIAGRYHRVSPARFWTISIFGHAGWFFCLGMKAGPGFHWDWAPLFIWWNAILIVISCVGLTMEWNQPKPPRKLSLAGSADPDRSSLPGE